MADSRFYRKARASFTLGELVELTGSALRGADPLSLVRDVATLKDAGPEDLAFFENRKYLAEFRQSKAGFCLAKPEDAEKAPEGMALLVNAQPYAAYAALAAVFYPGAMVPDYAGMDGVSPEASVDATAQVAASAVIGPGAEIGARAVIGPYAVIGAGVVVGEGSVVGAGAVVQYTVMGKGCILHPGVKIGQDGFGFAPTPTGLRKVPQLGRVMIGHQVEIGANTTIDRGTTGDTVIGDGSKIDNLVQIGHNVRLGRFCIVVAQTGISGSTVLEDGVVLGGQSGLAGHLHLGKGVQCAAQSGVIADVKAGEVVGGTPAVPIRQWHRQSVALARLVKK